MPTIPTKVDALRTIFRKNADRSFLTDVATDRSFTYEELEQISLKLAAFLLARGVVKGDRIAFILPNSAEHTFLFFACMHIGAIIVPINLRLRTEEIAVLLKEATPRVLFTTSVLQQKNAGMSGFVPGMQIITIVPHSTTQDVTGRDKNTGSIDIWKEVEKSIPSTVASFGAIRDEDVFALVYTSGTTSRPKGVPIAYGKIIANAQTFIAAYNLPPGVSFLGTFSQGYLGGLYNTLLFQYVAQGSVILDAGFTTDVALRFWETVQKYNVTALWLVPSMLSIILSLDRGTIGETYAPRGLKFVFVGTAPLTPDLKTQFEVRYGVRLYENYALSETLFLTANTPKLEVAKGCGRALPGCAVRIVDEQGRSCPPGTSGEIVVTSDYMASGYFKNPEETTRTFRDGLLYTGDVGYLTEDQSLIVTDRKKDIIIRGGINISPKEIEDVILRAVGVREVAVVGIPHVLTGEEIVAVVVGDAALHAEQLQTWCMEHLAPFKVPARILIHPELPRTASGKIQKNKVRELLTK